MKPVTETLSLEKSYDTYCKMVYRVCYTFMKNAFDTEDAVQETFMKRYRFGSVFKDAEHEKAWLIVTAGNVCKDMLKSKWNRIENVDDYDKTPVTENEHSEVLDAVLALPEKYKVVVYLHYYEGYRGEEIAAMLHRPHSTIRNHLSEARKLLRDALQ